MIQKMALLIDALAKATFFLSFASMSLAREVANLGKEINGIHTLNALEIFRNEDNLEAFKSIFDESKNSRIIAIIRENFKKSTIQGLVGRAEVTEKDGEGDILVHLPLFSERVHLSFDELRGFAEKKDWESFLNIVIYK